MFKSKSFWILAAISWAFFWSASGRSLAIMDILQWGGAAVLFAILFYQLNVVIKQSVVSEQRDNRRYSFLIKVYLKNGMQHEVTFYSDMRYDNIMDLARHTDLLTYERKYISWWRDGKQYSFLSDGISCVECIITDLKLNKEE